MRPGAHPDHGGAATGQRVVRLFGRQEMRVRLDHAGGHDQLVAMHDRRVRSGIQAGCDTGHDLRVPGLSDTDDAAAPHADVGLDDPEDRVDDQRVVHDKVQGPFGVGAAGPEPLAVAHDLAGPGGQFVAGMGVVVFDFRQQGRVAQADHVAGCRPVEARVPGTVHLHDGSSRYPRSAARLNAASRTAGSSARPPARPANPWISRVPA